MTAHERLNAVVARIEADPEGGWRHEEELHAALEELRRAGGEVPARLRDLDDRLIESAIEARFDNLPI
jgi:hypothetical protein